MKLLINLTLALGFIFLMSGCGGAQLVNVDKSKFFEKPEKMSKVERAIRSGAAKKGWRVKKVKSGLLEASIKVRNKFLVVVRIPYTNEGYKVNYKRSTNLKYDATKNTIHPSYNKWVAALVNNIDYQLENIGALSSTAKSPSTRAVTASATKVKYAKGKKISLAGKTLYIKSIAPYASGSHIASNIKAECSINKEIVDYIIKYSAQEGVKVVVKNKISSKDLELKIQIDDAVSGGSAFSGHNKYTVISGRIVKGKTAYYSFSAGRVSGGGFWGGYKSSCSVLNRTVNTLGKDVAQWLVDPYNDAKLGDAYLIH